MSSSSDKYFDFLKFDVRMMEYYLRQGLISTAEVEKYIKSLPDCSQNISTQKFDESGELARDEASEEGDASEGPVTH